MGPNSDSVRCCQVTNLPLCLSFFCELDKGHFSSVTDEPWHSSLWLYEGNTHPFHMYPTYPRYIIIIATMATINQAPANCRQAPRQALYLKYGIIPHNTHMNDHFQL